MIMWWENTSASVHHQLIYVSNYSWPKWLQYNHVLMFNISNVWRKYYVTRKAVHIESGCCNGLQYFTWKGNVHRNKFNGARLLFFKNFYPVELGKHLA